MNKHILTATLGKDSEVKELKNGNNVINFSVAHTETWKDKQGEKQERTTWYECEWFLSNTNISNYLKKGAKVLIEGAPYSRAYINQSNEAVSVNVVRVNYLEIIKFVEQQNEKVTQQHNTPQQNNYQQNIDEQDDLPF